MKCLKNDKRFFLDNERQVHKKKTLYNVLLSVFIKTLFESFLQPLLPFYIINYYNIEVKQLGILLSFYSLSQCIMCLVIGFFSFVNKKHLLSSLLILNLIGIYLFYIKLDFTFLIINRIICGSSSVFIVVVNAIINDLVDNNVCIYYTYINIFNAIGIILGPLLSSFILLTFNFQFILHLNTLGICISLFIIITISSDLVDPSKAKKNSYKIINGENIKDGLNEKYIEYGQNEYINEKKKHINNKLIKNSSENKDTMNYKKDDSECLINNYILNTNNNRSGSGIEEKTFNSYSEECSNLPDPNFLKKNDYFYISSILLHFKQKLDWLINTCFTYKYQCLFFICLFRFASAFSSNLMSNIFFVFYNDNVSSDNKQIQVSFFVSLSGIIMIFYQYFSFSYILKRFGYNG